MIGTKPTNLGSLGKDKGLIALWLVVIAGSAVVFALGGTLPALMAFPSAWTLPIDSFFQSITDWTAQNLKWFFRGCSWLLEKPMLAVNHGLTALSWLSVVACFLLVSWQGGGPKLCAISLCCLLYILGVGYWEESMNTLSLVLVSIPLSVGIGFLLGVWANRRPMVDRVMEPVLDFMQTIPAFAYLIRS